MKLYWPARGKPGSRYGWERGDGLRSQVRGIGVGRDVVVGFAQDATWALPGAGSFNTAGNWSPATVPNGTDVWASLGLTSTGAVNIATPVTLGRLDIVNNTGATTTLSGSAATTDLTFVVSPSTQFDNYRVGSALIQFIDANGAGITPTIAASTQIA